MAKKTAKTQEGVTCDRALLSKAVTFGMQAIDVRAPHPILQCFHLESKDGALLITAFSQESAIVQVVPVESEGLEFSVCVPAQRFKDLISSLDSINLNLCVEQESLMIKDDNGSFKLRIQGTEEYPGIPICDGDSDWVEVSSTELKRMMSIVDFASTDESKQVLNGLYLNDSLAYASDGSACACRKSTIEGKYQDCIIPRKRVSLLSGLSRDFVRMRRDRAFLEIQDGQTQIFIRLLDGQYPAIQSVLEKVEKQIQVEIKCDRRRLLQFLEQSILLQKGNDYATVDIQVAENLVLSTKTEDGESTRTMDFSWRFTDDVIAKSWRIQHWIQALKVIASPEVLIRMAHAAGFDIVASTGEESLMFAIAPMVKRG